jgi:hypothetical protein
MRACCEVLEHAHTERSSESIKTIDDMRRSLFAPLACPLLKGRVTLGAPQAVPMVQRCTEHRALATKMRRV